MHTYITHTNAYADAPNENLCQFTILSLYPSFACSIEDYLLPCIGPQIFTFCVDRERSSSSFRERTPTHTHTRTRTLTYAHINTYVDTQKENLRQFRILPSSQTFVYGIEDYALLFIHASILASFVNWKYSPYHSVKAQIYSAQIIPQKEISHTHTHHIHTHLNSIVLSSVTEMIMFRFQSTNNFYLWLSTLQLWASHVITSHLSQKQTSGPTDCLVTFVH